MQQQVDARLRRYLRVAYEGGAEEATEDGPRRRPGRWAMAPSVAVRVAAVLLVLGAAATTVLLLSAGAEGPGAVPALPPPAVTAAAPGEGAATPTDGRDPTAPAETDGGAAELVVHVAGAVASPGVVTLPPGTRVDAAILAAGGATAEADLDALNLAAPVTDGQQVYVPVEGEAPPPAGASGSGTSPGGGGPATTGGLVDLNTADAAALDTLPGVGPAIAERIIAHRTEHGPFPSVEALTDVSGIGPATMDRLRDLVTV